MSSENSSDNNGSRKAPDWYFEPTHGGVPDHSLRNARVLKLFTAENGSEPKLQPEMLYYAIEAARVKGTVPEIIGFDKNMDLNTGATEHKIGLYGVQIIFPRPDKL